MYSLFENRGSFPIIKKLENDNSGWEPNCLLLLCFSRVCVFVCFFGKDLYFTKQESVLVDVSQTRKVLMGLCLAVLCFLECLQYLIQPFQQLSFLVVRVI